MIDFLSVRVLIFEMQISAISCHCGLMNVIFKCACITISSTHLSHVMSKPAFCKSKNNLKAQMAQIYVASTQMTLSTLFILDRYFNDLSIPKSDILSLLAIFYGCTAPFVSDLYMVKNSEDRFLAMQLSLCAF